ncbi:MAG: DUF4129 domain-containing protein [Planctomycetes bacterium]|nr:DUF4129 domain-containing protein [Planctomycetota bacterium]
MRHLLALVLPLSLSLAAAAPAAAEAISASEYHRRLVAIRDAIEADELAAVRDRAASLLPIRVRDGELEFAADRSVLGPLSRAKDRDEFLKMLPRLEILIRELDASRAPPDASPSDRELLESLRREEEAREMREGGEVGGIPVEGIDPDADISLPERVQKWIEDAARWLREKIQDFFAWLRDLFEPRVVPAADAPGIAPWVWAMIGLVAAIILVLAWRAFRNRQAKEPEPEVRAGEARARPIEENPLARTVSEWERLALELAAQGRFRESARAWYLAVLSTLCRAGLLQYRKGRTNWEYVLQLPVAFQHRPDFVEITRDFDRLWYGRGEANAELHDSFSGRSRRILDQAGARRGVA